MRWLHPHEKEYTKYHSTDAWSFADYYWSNLTPCFALSGYFAMQIAYIMGADKIILCGCPGDTTRRFFDIPGQRREAGDPGYDREGVTAQLLHEMERLPDFKSKVRSMSGWTKFYFGSV